MDSSAEVKSSIEEETNPPDLEEIPLFLDTSFLDNSDRTEIQQRLEMVYIAYSISFSVYISF